VRKGGRSIRRNGAALKVMYAMLLQATNTDVIRRNKEREPNEMDENQSMLAGCLGRKSRRHMSVANEK
jgi:hypothetical protein